jgi:hypothetical protein
MLNKKRVGKFLVNELMGVNATKRKKRRKAKEKKLQKRWEETQMMYRVYGKLRYYLSLWFGKWILFSWRKPPG